MGIDLFQRKINLVLCEEYDDKTEISTVKGTLRGAFSILKFKETGR
nr:MAG TPA_asm: hypothetical protein [Caudoviricetes sp.]